MGERQRSVGYGIIVTVVCSLLSAPVGATPVPLTVPSSEVVTTQPDSQPLAADTETPLPPDIAEPAEPLPETVAPEPPTEPPAALTIPLTETSPSDDETAPVVPPPEPPATDPVVPPVELDLTPIRADADMIVSGFEVRDGKLVALEIKNRTKDLLDVHQWSLTAVYLDGTNETSCQVLLSGYLLPSRSTTLTQPGVDVVVDHQGDAAAYAADFACAQSSGQLVMIEVSTTADTPEVVERIMVEQAAPALDGRWVRKASYNGDIDNFYLPGSAGSERLLYYDRLYLPPASAPLMITELYITPLQCAPADTAVRCFRYVKVTNVSQQPVDLGLYRLRAGSVQSQSTASNTTPLSGVLAPGETRLIVSSDSQALYLDADEGTAWFEDRLGVTRYLQSSTVTPYEGADTVAHTGLSWAFDQQDSQWKWSLPSPDSVDNTIALPTSSAPVETEPESADLVPCRPDQYRSPETNRCRKRATASSSLTPCRADQYRSPDTNRCRLIASTANVLTPCRDNQYRSEVTNRCRLISSASSQLVPCKENQYRNETTNRCRTITNPATIPAAAFAVEPLADTGKAFVGWWLLGGAAAVALGYAAWEWRHEMMKAIRAIGGVFGSHK